MSARIAPRTDTMGIGFSPQHPKFDRNTSRKKATAPPSGRPVHSDHLALPAGFGASDAEGQVPPETLFETALIANQGAGQHLSPYEIAQRLRRDWSPPASTFPLADKTI